jgi:1,4-dihydroxy-2-naphthoate octaprenyltransferase
MKLSNYKAWLAAARPKTLAASISPVLVACALAHRNGYFKPVPAALCFLVALFAQIASNLANDYFDFKNGADTDERLGPQRAVASGWIKPRSMLIATLITLAIACVCGCGLLFYGEWWLIFVGLAIAICVLAYSAGPFPLASNGLGDVCVLLFYGVIPLCFSYYIQTGEFTLTSFLLSLSMGLISINILIVNNYRDYVQDAAANKKTTIVLFGRKFGRIFYLTNAILAVVLAYPAYLYRDKGIWFMFIFFLFIELFTWQDLGRLQGKELNRTLGMTSRNVLLFALLLVSVLAF